MDLKKAVVSSVILATALIGAQPVVAQDDNPIRGRWSGTIHDATSPFKFKGIVDIDKKLNKGEKGGESSYPDLGCTGDLILKKHRDRSPKYIFAEKFPLEEPCINGFVTLTLDDKKLLYHQEVEGVQENNGTLKRVGGA